MAHIRVRDRGGTHSAVAAVECPLGCRRNTHRPSHICNRLGVLDLEPSIAVAEGSKEVAQAPSNPFRTSVERLVFYDGASYGY